MANESIKRGDQETSELSHYKRNGCPQKMEMDRACPQEGEQQHPTGSPYMDTRWEEKERQTERDVEADS